MKTNGPNKVKPIILGTISGTIVMIASSHWGENPLHMWVICVIATCLTLATIDPTVSHRVLLWRTATIMGIMTAGVIFGKVSEALLTRLL